MHATPAACAAFKNDAVVCLSRVELSGEAFDTVRFWEQKGYTPNQAARINPGDSGLQYQAAEAPASMTRNEFEEKTFFDCLEAAAD